MLVTLVCPDCRKELAEKEGSFVCGDCGKEFHASHGVLSFLEGDEKYNEGAYEEYQKRNWSKHAVLRERVRKSWFLSLLNRIRIRISMSGRRDRLFADFMKRGDRESVIMDLGCGPGRHYFCDYGRVVGVDPELKLLFA